MGLKPLHIQVFLPCSSSFGTKILEGASRFAREMPHVQLLVSNELGAQVDGILAAPHDQACIESVKAINLPVVNVTDIELDPSLPTVMGDNEEIGKVAAEYFLGRGYHHFGVYGWNDVPCV